MKGNCISNQGARAFANILKLKELNLVLLNLAENDIKDDGGVYLAYSLTFNSSL